MIGGELEVEIRTGGLQYRLVGIYLPPIDLNGGSRQKGLVLELGVNAIAGNYCLFFFLDCPDRKEQGLSFAEWESTLEVTAAATK